METQTEVPETITIRDTLTAGLRAGSIHLEKAIKALGDGEEWGDLTEVAMHLFGAAEVVETMLQAVPILSNLNAPDAEAKAYTAMTAEDRKAYIDVLNHDFSA